MENYLIDNEYNYDGTTIEGKIAKVLAATTIWASSTSTVAVGNTDYPAKRIATGFTGLPGGNRHYNGAYIERGVRGTWWSSTEVPTTTAWFRYLFYNNSDFVSLNYSRPYGFSIRCVKD